MKKRLSLTKIFAATTLKREEEEENDENERMWLCYDEDNARCIPNFKISTKYIYIYI